MESLKSDHPALSPSEALKKYWGYAQFRPLQEEIIDHISAGKDTLALLPTGGGKSICFQVPAMMKEGICIVVSPLIALMKDQVANLEKLGIKALNITSEFSFKQIDAMLDRCIYDKEIKFLYLSPERLMTDLVRERMVRMNVNYIAVDEAHCISEWGYDFRPPYLEIAQIRALIPKVPIIALTASATPAVVKDIQEKLGFQKGKVFRKSFQRDNLAYFMLWDEDKIGKTVRIIQKRGGTGIIYARSRSGTERLSRELQRLGISADFYHAGLATEVRSEKQNRWMTNQTQVIVATNAFGMGIDKPDVRFVIHLDLPDTLENYYQECGRAGRDGQKAFAISILTEADVDKLRHKLLHAFPEKKEIIQAYNAVGSYLQLAVGSGLGETFPIDLNQISERFDIVPRKVFQALKFLEKEGLVSLSETSGWNARLKIIANNEAFYQFQVSNPKLDPLTNGLLRSYARLFEEHVNISEWAIAKRAKWPKDKVVKGLQYLAQLGLVEYEPSNNLPRLTYTKARIEGKNIRISDEHYAFRKQIVSEKIDAIIHYAQHHEKCRSRLITEYFGEKDTKDCGICDYCIAKKKGGL